MKLSKLAIQIKLNITQPLSHEDLYWKAFDMVMGGYSSKRNQRGAFAGGEPL